MINLAQIKSHVIIPALNLIDMGGPDAVALVFNTGLVESRYQYIAQVGGGPALSFWQIEPDTMVDIYANYLNYRQPLKQKVDSIRGLDAEFQLSNNLAFAAILCRLKYRRSPIPLPKFNDTQGQAHIWKQAYNTPKGKGTEKKFIEIVKELNIN